MNFYFRPNNELEGYDLIKKNSIQTSDDKEPIDEIVATVYSLEGLGEFIVESNNGKFTN